MALVFGAAPAAAQQAPAAGGPARLQGTFLQLQRPHLSWQPADWDGLFRHLKELQVHYIVIQWAAHDGVEFFTPTGDGGASTLGTILNLAADHGIKVFVGLDYRSRFWQALEGGLAEAEAFLRESAERSLAIAGQLDFWITQHPAFAGWYLTEEIDDETWHPEERRRVLHRHLSAMADRLHRLTPGAKVAISGFSNGHNTPETVESFWASLLGAAALDVVLFQDGVGAGKLRLDQLSGYFAAVKRAADGQRRLLWIVPELFEQVGGPPVDDGPFRAVAAPFDRLRQQLLLAAPFSATLIGFSIPEYMSPFGDLAANRLYTDYLRGVLGQ